MAIDTRRQGDLVRNQDKLTNANVLILGCGAVGSVVAPMLQRMGVRQFTLIDGDDVEDHNLNRQLFSKMHVGKNKAIALAAQMRGIDPEVSVEVVPNYVQADELDLAKFTHLIFAADTLYLEGQVYEKLRKMERPPAFISPRMNGYLLEMFTYIPGVVEPKGIYFATKPDKDYGAGASCTGPKVEPAKISAIATTTNILCGLAAQAFVASTQDMAVKGHIRLDLLSALGGEPAVIS